MVREKKVYATSNASTTSDGEISSITSGTPLVKRRASRAGTRCVSTLSSDQLTRKRANDREAQRAIRQRAKDHIEGLERRIEELTKADGGDTAALVDAQKRNRELEQELHDLRERFNQVESPSHSYGEWPSDRESSASNSVLNAIGPYSTESPTNPRGGYQPSHMSAPRLVRSTVTGDVPNEQHFKIESHSATVVAEQPFCVSVPLQADWDEQGPQTTAVFNLAAPYVIPSFLPVDNESPPLIWQSSLRSWELPIKYLPPTGLVDTLLLTILQEQRDQIPSGTIQGTQLIRPASMRGLLYSKQDSTDTSDPVSNAIAEILHGTEMPSLPEKAACLFVMHRLLCWQIVPVLATYEKIPEWFSPRPSQLVEAHALWVSQIPWPKLRDKVIRNQLQYSTVEFQEHYNISLSVNWPYRDIDILMFEDVEVKITPTFENHVMKLENWSLNAPFATRYPELQKFCKFGNVGF